MTIVSGEVGLRFNITESNIITDVGTASIVTTMEESINNIPLSNSDVVVALSGTVDNTGTTIDLTAIQNVDSLVLVRGTAPVALDNIKAIFVANKSSTQNVVVSASASNSFLAASDQMTINPLSGLAAYCGTEIAIATATNENIDITGQVGGTAIEVYIIGN